MTTQYYRCKNCGHVFEDEKDKCPNCGAEVDKSVNEDVNAEPVFNILD